MKIIKNAYAGTLESSDLFVQIIKTDEKGINIQLESSVEEIYGDDIKDLIIQIIHDLEIKDINLKIQDKGAFDFTIKARVQAAILRACDEKTPNWSKL